MNDNKDVRILKATLRYNVLIRDGAIVIFSKPDVVRFTMQGRNNWSWTSILREIATIKNLADAAIDAI